MTPEQIEALAELEKRRFLLSIQTRFITRASDVDEASAKEQLAMGLKVALIAAQEIEAQGQHPWDVELMLKIYGGK